MKINLSLFSFIFVLMMWVAALAAEPAISFEHVPDGGLQPQGIVDTAGVIHLIYFKGDAAHGDVFYVRSSDSAKTFSAPIRVNSHAGSAIAIGTVRGAHIAVGKNNRVHVAWMGSDQAVPKAGPTGKDTPMMYARMNDAGTAFEVERNLISAKVGLDGGGSLAADAMGNVMVGWHAPPKPKAGEANRAVWVAVSKDQGKTFAPETQAWDEHTGACGCCGMNMFAGASGAMYILYRTAGDSVNRDMELLISKGPGQAFSGHTLSHWEIASCPMSTESFAATQTGVLAAWEDKQQILMVSIDGGAISRPTSPPGNPANRKHPSLAVGTDGTVLLAWAEGTAWQKGGSVAYQLLDKDLKPLAGATGNKRGLPAWSMPCVLATKTGFVVLY
jgi:hypothetical protein